MRLIPHSFNGFLFQQSTRVASGWEGSPFNWGVSGISSVNTPRSQNFPLYTIKNYSGAVKVINVVFTGSLDIIGENRNDLIKAMDVMGEDQHQLIALDELGRKWYINAICNVPMNVESFDENALSAGVAFETDDPTWRKYNLSTQQILVSGTGGATITPLGNQLAYPIIKITPTGVGSFGFAYRLFVTIINNSPNALNAYPLDITDGGIDTAALVLAGKVLSNGDDLRVFIDGAEVKRWLQGMNTANTKIWTNWTQPAKSTMTLGATIAGTGDVDTITFENTPANVALMAIIPNSGGVIIGSEIFIYTGKNVTNLQLTGCTRAERLTSEAAHSVGATVDFVTHDVWIYYGNPGIDPYVVDDSHKPLIKLTSTNISHIYEDAFFSGSGLRSGAWSKFKAGGATVGGVYYGGYGGTTPTFAAPPPGFAVTMGMAALYSFDGLPYTMEWKLYNPCGITEITDAQGNKYRKDTNWDAATFEKSVDGSLWVIVWTESSPSVADTWENLDAHTSVALSATYYYVKFKMYEVPTAPPPEMIKVHEVTDVTVALDAAKVPTINISAEDDAFNLLSVFSNAATGKTMTINRVMQIGTYMIVNTKEKTITLFDGSNQMAALVDMPVRAQWFELLPDEPNIITITDAGDVTYDFSWEDGAL